ncbi:MAG: AEC family transporter [Ruminococcus sp.]|nr:AEC family transporter [Ruminococcus sp.]
MLSNFITVGQQVLILFILIFVGFFSRKLHLIKKGAVKGMTNLVLYFVTPCVMVHAFQDAKFSYDMLTKLLITTLAGFAVHIGSIVVATAIFREKDISRRIILKFSTVFSNCGFMSLPLQEALLGSEGVFYGSIFVAVFNIVSWTYGLVIMSGNIRSISAKKLATNPGILGVVAAIILWVLNIHLPEIISEPIGYLAALNTPLPMIIIGCHLATADLKSALTDKWSYVSISLRMVLIPICTMFLLYLCGIKGSMLIAIVIASSAPTAATTTMFATTYDREVSLSVSLVSLTTLISLFTMPIIVAFSQTFA